MKKIFFLAIGMINSQLNFMLLGYLAAYVQVPMAQWIIDNGYLSAAVTVVVGNLLFELMVPILTLLMILTLSTKYIRFFSGYSILFFVIGIWLGYICSIYLMSFMHITLVLQAIVSMIAGQAFYKFRFKRVIIRDNIT